MKIIISIPIYVAALLATLLTMSSKGLADSCVIPELGNETSCSVSVPGESIPTTRMGIVELFNDVGKTQLSDLVIFTNVNGVATVILKSDPPEGFNPSPTLPILAKFTEPSSGFPISWSVPLNSGMFLTAKICSDVEGRTCFGFSSDSLSVELTRVAVPEPETFLLLGSGLFGSGLWNLRRLLKNSEKQIPHRLKADSE